MIRTSTTTKPRRSDLARESSTGRSTHDGEANMSMTSWTRAEPSGSIYGPNRTLEPHMDMVRATLVFYYFHTFPFAKLAQDLPYRTFFLSIKNLLPILLAENHMVFAVPLRVIQSLGATQRDLLLICWKRPTVWRLRFKQIKRSFTCLSIAESS